MISTDAQPLLRSCSQCRAKTNVPAHLYFSRKGDGSYNSLCDDCCARQRLKNERRKIATANTKVDDSSVSKKCTNCKVVKPLDQYRTKGEKLTNSCISCLDKFARSDQSRGTNKATREITRQQRKQQAGSASSEMPIEERNAIRLEYEQEVREQSTSILTPEELEEVERKRAMNRERQRRYRERQKAGVQDVADSA
ncbi:uncharacterized protein BJ171DRAFT_481053 [Polychytrium aggregatum]|uniref:uncharacterized protein n=1 Tax=Polychytrium aggregatum TaxID=110093 RepID=UPI0022FF0F43|nr:uncharacterized protein BJ171DRAFT_481053 [Polychytrium aggregatum]KAI9192985.1 hypothetical protein BJ171DRAFT_481053 [Polychytrium aggregatum]